LKNRAMLRATATMSVSSSNTVGHAGGAQAQHVVLAPDVEVELGVVLVGAQDAHGDAAGDGGLELLAAAHAAAVLLDERAERDAQVELVDAGLVDVAAHAHELGAVAGRAADRGLARPGS
jgi:hypothetical protein